jgi:hypothetical protein
MEYQDTKDALNGTQGMKQRQPEYKICHVRNAFTLLRGRYEAFYEDGQVRVWDSVGGYYTTCHSLTDNQVAYVKRMANRDAS